MQRIAFLIGDGHSGGGALPGVAQDKASYRTFLESDGGGAWRKEEIFDIGTVGESDLSAALAAGGSAAYALVVFSGHGCLDARSARTYCCIGANETVHELQLNTGAARQLTVIDACRKKEDIEIIRKSERTALGKIEDDASRRLYREACRALFDSLVMQADPGLSLVYACSPGESAADTPRGGAFSAALVDEAWAWAEKTRQRNSGARYWLSIDGAFRSATSALAALRVPQKPAAYLGRRQVQFPFAVA